MTGLPAPSAAPSAAQARSPVLRLLPSVLTVFLGYLAVGVPLPVLPGQVHGALGYGTVIVGLVIGFESAATLLSRRLGSQFCDTRGPKPASALGLGLAAVSGLVTMLSTAPGLGGLGALTVLLLGRVLLGIGQSFFLTGAMTWGIALVGPQNSGKVMAWNGIAIYGALSVGAPLGATLGMAHGFRTAIVLAALLPALGLALALLRTGTPPLGGRRMPFFRVVGAIWQPGAALGLATVGYATLAAFLVLLYAARGWSGAGYALTAFGVSYILVRMLIGGFPDRFGARRVAIPSLLIEAAGQALIWAAPSEPFALLGAAVTGAGYSLLFPCFGVDAVGRVPPARRAAALGAFAAFFDAALGLSAPLVGVLVEWQGFGAAFVAGGLAPLAAIPLALRLRPRPKLV